MAADGSGEKEELEPPLEGKTEFRNGTRSNRRKSPGVGPEMRR